MNLSVKQPFQGLTLFLFLIVVVQLVVPFAIAAGSLQWTPLDNGVTVSDAEFSGAPGSAAEQRNSQVIKTRDSNYIVVWEDQRDDNKDIYAQKLQAVDGASVWAEDGVPVVSASGSQMATSAPIALVSDNANGAIIAWDDNRGGSNAVYAHRLDEDGEPVWTANGILIDTMASNPIMAEDGSGGMYLAWVDTSAGTADILITRVKSDGTVDDNWNLAGSGTFRPVSVAGNGGLEEINPQIIVNEDGEVFVSYFFVDGTNNTVAATKLDTNGGILWQNQIIFQNVGSTNHQQGIVSDGNGGIIVAVRYVVTVRVQRLDSNGSALWAANGELLMEPSLASVGRVRIIDDNTLPTHGAIVVWEDTRTTRNEIYAQRVNSDGDAQWTAGGIAISNTADNIAASSPLIVSNGGYGAIIAYNSNNHIYAQHLNSNGDALWTANGGEQIETAVWNQVLNGLAPDGNGGAVIVWAGTPSGATHDVYAQYITDSVGGICSEDGSQSFCGEQQITEAILTFQTIPESFSFDTITAGSNQDVFNNNSTDDPPKASSPGADLLKIYDNRNNGGFIVDISTTGTFTDGTNTIPLTNLYVITTLDESDPKNGDPNNNEEPGVTYSASIPGGSNGVRNIVAPAYVDTDIEAVDDKRVYIINDTNTQLGGSPLILMDGTLPALEGRNGTMSQFISFYLRIDATQPAGEYAVTLTYTLTDSTL